MNSGSARPLSNVAAFKLGLLEAGDPKRPGAIQSAASQPVSDTPATELSFFDPLAGIQAAAFSFMPIELDDAAAR